MTMQSAASSESNLWEEFQQLIESNYEQTSRTLKEVKLMLEQSQTEISRLTQRNASITSHLALVQSQFETISREDIRTAYTAALDSQQRLLVMRSQLDKNQTEFESLQHYQEMLLKVRDFLSHDISSNSKTSAGGASKLEMVIKAQESERQRLSRQMHDGPAQTLSNFIVQAEIANRLLDIDPKRAKDELDNLKNAAMNSFKEVRTFIFDLRPMMLDDLGLLPTLRRYLESFKEQTGAEVNFNFKGSERRLESYLEVMLFRAVQELVGNAFYHNQDAATKVQINVQMVTDENVTKISVADNGKGFDPKVIDKDKNLGVKVIRERVEMVGGFMEIDSDVGKGSRISFQVPTIEAGSQG